jgi:hypothetical protein
MFALQTSGCKHTAAVLPLVAAPEGPMALMPCIMQTLQCGIWLDGVMMTPGKVWPPNMQQKYGMAASTCTT